MTNRPRTPTPAEDIAAQQSKIIVSLREQNTSLIETNQQQAQRIEYLEGIATEYRTFKSAFATGQTTYSTAMQAVLNQQNAVAKANADRINYERQVERDLEAANREAEQEATVLKEHPELTKQLEEGKTKLEKDKQVSYELTNRWFDMTDEDLEKYRSHDHGIQESPVAPIITVEEENARGSTIKKVNFYICDACFGSSYISLDLCEHHIFTEDHEMHRDAVLSEIDKDKSTKLVKLNAEYKQDIQNHIKSKAQQEYINQQRQQRAAEKREKDQLPFVRQGGRS